jgi:hypothetical protein
MDTALDIARNERACDLHQLEERPYFVNALYAGIGQTTFMGNEAED